MDNLDYSYYTGNPNRLQRVLNIDFNPNSPFGTEPVQIQPNNTNYEFDLEGRLVIDAAASKYYTYYDATSLTKAIYISGAKTQKIEEYKYDERGHRIEKISYSTNGTPTTRVRYFNDINGNNVEITEEKYTTTIPTAPSWVLNNTERYLFGSQMLGVFNATDNKYYYQLTDHVGNIRAMVARDKVNNAVQVTYLQDYYPHGSAMPNRSYVLGKGSRFGYQGTEQDNSGKNAFDLRLYDSKLGQWLTPDPMMQHASPYLAMSNNPVSFMDPTGGEDWSAHQDNYHFMRAMRRYERYGYDSFFDQGWDDGWGFGTDASGNKRQEFNARNILEIKKAKDAGYTKNKDGSYTQKELIGVSHNTRINPNTGQREKIEGSEENHYRYRTIFIGSAFENSSAQSGGDEDFWSSTAGLINSYTSPKADFVGRAVENKVGQILTDRAKYGKLHPETIIRTPRANINVSTKLLQNTGTALKWGGRAFGALGLVGTYAQWQTGQIGNGEAALDATFGAIGFIPGYGWAVSGAYFLIAKPLYNYATKL